MCGRTQIAARRIGDLAALLTSQPTLERSTLPLESCKSMHRPAFLYLLGDTLFSAEGCVAWLPLAPKVLCHTSGRQGARRGSAAGGAVCVFVAGSTGAQSGSWLPWVCHTALAGTRTQVIWFKSA